MTVSRAARRPCPYRTTSTTCTFSSPKHANLYGYLLPACFPRGRMGQRPRSDKLEFLSQILNARPLAYRGATVYIAGSHSHMGGDNDLVLPFPAGNFPVGQFRRKQRLASAKSVQDDPILGQMLVNRSRITRFSDVDLMQQAVLQNNMVTLLCGYAIRHGFGEDCSQLTAIPLVGTRSKNEIAMCLLRRDRQSTFRQENILLLRKPGFLTN